ncbi:MAG TPA: methylated-DNA--[protein]-cysteine S-methyltransferase [Chloroflexota bacterium]|jgi:O-6-methylguanine DNA methyltransferase|nr:methylated-DNA--[protein]-cysteine S-methyltransferase [Chloroflexota bacterium]
MQAQEWRVGAEDAIGRNTTVTLGQLKTPLGLFGAALTSAGLGRLTFPAEPYTKCEVWARRWEPQARSGQNTAALNDLAEQLTAYLEGDLRYFRVALDLRGTPFQVAVWQALQQIGYGELRSYGAVAAAIGRPSAVRPVGAANGANPVPIIVPCHRVIGSNGLLTGYGGGMELKAWLLRREGLLPAGDTERWSGGNAPARERPVSRSGKERRQAECQKEQPGNYLQGSRGGGVADEAV